MVDRFDNIQSVAVLVVIFQKLKIMNCFDFYKNIVLENKTDEQIQYFWEKKTTNPYIYFTIKPFNHPPFLNFTIGQFKIEYNEI